MAQADVSQIPGDHIEVVHRDLPYSTFDADNHLYERPESFTKFLPKQYAGVVKYVEVNGRTKLAVRDRISEYIPNPTFSKVGAPGSAGLDATKPGAPVKIGFSGYQKLVAMPGIDAFFDPEPRLQLMKEMGIDRTLMWATLGNALEERLAEDPDAACAVVHAFNQWIQEHWSFAYADAIYPAPIISLAVLERALEELEYVAEHGAKIFHLRVATVPTWKGRKSFALPEFDPFWERVQELDLAVGMHSGDPGYQRYTNEWEGLGDQEFNMSMYARRARPGFVKLASEKDPLIDAVASIIGHGLATRFPKLKFMPVEYETKWIRPFYAKLQRAWDEAPEIFDENPVEVFNRNLFVHLFHEPDPKGLIEMGIPADRLLFGSDFPHPEGMADPLAYADVVSNLPPDQQALLMGGSLEKAIGVGPHARRTQQ